MKTTMFLLLGSLIAFTGRSYSPAQSETGNGFSMSGPEDEPDNDGWLGVTIEDITPELAGDLKTQVKDGAVVSAVQEGSPAEKAGLRKNDIIVAMNEHSINDRWDLLRRVRSENPGTSVTLTVVRDNEKQEITAVLGEQTHDVVRVDPMVRDLPHDPFHISGSAPNGLRLLELNEQLGEFFGAPHNRGVLVEEVRSKSSAATAGFKAGDIIVRVGKEPVEDIMDVHNAFRHYERGDTARIEVLRKGRQVTLSLLINRRSGDRFEFHSSSGAPFPPQGMFELNSRRFQERMGEFGERMRAWGDDLRSNMEGLGQRIKEQLRHVRI